MWRPRNPQVILLSATQSLSKAIHEDRLLILNVLSGHTITLPASTGGKTLFRLFENPAPTSGSTIIKVANTTDIMQGSLGVTGTTSGTFGTTTTSDTITENRTTTGGALAGAWIELFDIQLGIWFVRGVLNGSGTVATPFSASV